MNAWLVRIGAVFLGGWVVVPAVAQGLVPTSPPGKTAVPATLVPTLGQVPAITPGPDFTTMRPFQKQAYFSAKGGMQWLMRCNQPNGRFLYGYVPALATPLLEDHYTHQVAAAYALARAAVQFRDERAAALARQGVLTLLLETEIDPSQPNIRRPVFAVNGLANAGWLVMAIHTLPNPGSDLLEQAEQLCNFIRLHQDSDGAFSRNPGDPEGKGTTTHDVDSGPALYGLMLSLNHQQAEWKLEAVRKACAFYHPHWKSQKSLAMIPLHTAAYSQAYLRTKEPAFAACVTEMNDWLCTRQFQQLNGTRLMWFGGFSTEGNSYQAPDIHSAACAESLAHACQIARQHGDLARFNNYRGHIERCLQFLTGLQYTQANSQHIVERYQPEILGGFHRSHQDGNIRIDYIQEAICTYLQYLATVDPVEGRE
jgi:hypothetical protein